jgi:hypothetical protein
MPLQEHALSTTVNVTVPTTTETIIATTPPINTYSDSDIVGLVLWGQMTFGTGATGVTVRCRRGTTVSGALVGSANAISATGGNTNQVPLHVTDQPGLVAGQQYVYTVQQTAATGNGTVLQNKVQITTPVN